MKRTEPNEVGHQQVLVGSLKRKARRPASGLVQALALDGEAELHLALPERARTPQEANLFEEETKLAADA
jgi:hypothetical protein